MPNVILLKNQETVKTTRLMFNDYKCMAKCLQQSEKIYEIQKAF